jgi:predicted lipid-binding transport protein (Tim44 family)
MNERHDPHLLPDQRPRMPWAQRLLIAALGMGLVIAGFFFLVFALLAGALLATVIGIRLWWVMRKLRAEARNTVALEGEYTVIERAGTAERLER